MNSQNKQDAFASLEIEMMSDLYNRWLCDCGMYMETSSSLFAGCRRRVT